MKKLIQLLLSALLLINVASATEKSDSLSPYYGTYVPEVYLNGLKEYKAHGKASRLFRMSNELLPNVIVFNKEELQLNFNFHEGYSQKLVESNLNSITVESYDGKHVYNLEGNQSIYVDNVKYVKIDECTNMNENVISRFLANYLLPEKKLKSGKNTLCISKGKIYYNRKTYFYGTAIVFASHKYDSIVSKNSGAEKYIEILENQINIYKAYSPDDNYDLGWEENAIYELEASFKY